VRLAMTIDWFRIDCRRRLGALLTNAYRFSTSDIYSAVTTIPPACERLARNARGCIAHVVRRDIGRHERPIPRQANVLN
jgi:hypothetical protein